MKVRIFHAAAGRCHICGLKVFGKGWEVEHIRPLALGGADNESNMAPAHESCHARKTVVDLGRVAKAKRQEAKHLGVRKRSTFPCGRNSKWKKPINGPAVLR